MNDVTECADANRSFEKQGKTFFLNTHSTNLSTAWCRVRDAAVTTLVKGGAVTAGADDADL